MVPYTELARHALGRFFFSVFIFIWKHEDRRRCAAVGWFDELVAIPLELAVSRHSNKSKWPLTFTFRWTRTIHNSTWQMLTLLARHSLNDHTTSHQTTFVANVTDDLYIYVYRM